MDFFTLHIQPGKGEVSDRFYQLGIISIREAFDFIKTLPYKRNSNKSSKLTVLNEEQGTCSTKHTILKLLCEEQGITDVLLFTRVFIMSSNYHSGVAKVLNHYGLSGIPEAHVFLKYDNSIIDCTSVNSSLEAFLSSINLYEEQIETH